MIGDSIQYFWAGAPDDAQPRMAWVVCENPDKTVNVAGFDHNGGLFADMSVSLLKKAPPVPEAPAAPVRPSWAMKA